MSSRSVAVGGGAVQQQPAQRVVAVAAVLDELARVRQHELAGQHALRQQPVQLRY